MTTPNKGSERPDLLARLRVVLDEAERDKGWHTVDCELMEHYVPRRCDCGGTERRDRQITATREVLDRHRPRANQPGRPDACDDCHGGIYADDPAAARPCGCWGLSEPICGVCAQDGTAMRRYPQFWPCADVLTEAKRWGVES